ncbi:hypothetical protein HK097_000573 [Rhizophlyctis rosea]|uniref:Uncharacterized protein n=1 Tax=Rhizophlyctis rosea TaxID=64517 RepID=A0AAD5SJW0_9FUNG|nr:hypothetical protein HK097_000573 [Rhizophlyctis rosea]
MTSLKRNNQPPIISAEQLCIWSRELGYGSSLASTTGAGVKELALQEAERLCKHQLMPLWEFLTQRVKPKKKAGAIQRELNGQPGDPAKAKERRQLIERRNALKARLKLAQDRAEMVANNCEAVSHAIQNLDCRLRDMTTSVSKRGERAALCSAAQKEVAQYLKLLKEYLTMLETQSHRPHTKSTSDVEAQLKATISKISAAVKQSMLGDSPQDASDLRESILAGAEGSSASHILQMLSKEVRQTTEAIQVDTPRDSQGSSSAVARSHLQEACAKHVNLYTETEQMENDIVRLQKEYNGILEGALAAADVHDGESAKWIRTQLTIEADRQGAEAAHAVACKYLNKLTGSSDELSKRWEDIRAKQDAAAEYRNVIEKQLTMAQALESAIAKYRGKLQSQTAAISNFAENRLMNDGRNLQSSIDMSIGYMAEEVQSFEAVSLRKLDVSSCVSNDKPVALDSLSIYRIDSHPLLASMLDLSDQFSDKSIEHLIPMIHKLKMNVSQTDAVIHKVSEVQKYMLDGAVRAGHVWESKESVPRNMVGFLQAECDVAKVALDEQKRHYIKQHQAQARNFAVQADQAESIYQEVVGISKSLS